MFPETGEDRKEWRSHGGDEELPTIHLWGPQPADGQSTSYWGQTDKNGWACVSKYLVFILIFSFLGELFSTQNIKLCF